MFSRVLNSGIIVIVEFLFHSILFIHITKECYVLLYSLYCRQSLYLAVIIFGDHYIWWSLYLAV